MKIENKNNIKSLIPLIAIIVFLVVLLIYINNKIKSINFFYNPQISVKDNSHQKVVYFTFDADMTPLMKQKLEDGKVKSWYSKNLTSYIEKENIPVTIFVTGMFAEIYPDLIKELAQNSNIVIGNHTYDHSGFESPCYGLKIIKSDKEKIDEIEKTQSILKSLIGYNPKYFRHPGLCHNNHDDVLVKNIGLIVSDGSLVSGDAFNNNAKYIEKNVLNNIHDGSVVVLHLGGPYAPATESAFKYIVESLKKQNYVFKSLK